MAVQVDSQAPTIVVRLAWLIGLALAALVVIGHRSSPIAAVALGLMVVVAAWLSVIDLQVHRLPNPIVGTLALAVVIAVLVAGLVTGDISQSSRAIAFGMAAVALFFLANLVGGMGMGDVKYVFPLVTALGWFGWLAIASAAMATAATGAVAATVALATGRGRKYRLPYGPFMSLGLVAGLLRVAGW